MGQQGRQRRAGTRGADRNRGTGRGGERHPQGVSLKRSDVVEFIDEHAARIAAPDVAALVAEGPALRARVAALEGTRFQDLRRQVREALACLDDHVGGRCPQIPYYTISVLAAALFYFQSPVDAVPDFLPRLGAVDDAMIMAVATEMAADGLRRYQTWKSTES